MRILVIGDCHGDKPEIPDIDYDLVLAVGDICGGTDEMRKHMFQAIESEKPWYELMGEEKAREEVRKSIKEGREILQQLNNLDVPVFIVPGNWDWSGEIYENWGFLDGRGYEKMVSKYENIHDINFSREELGEFSFIGYGPCSGPELPQYEDDEPETKEAMEELKQDYQEKKEILQRLFEAGPNVIFLSHNVPNDTDLDMIDNEDSPKDGRHYGSIIVRELIEEYGPEFSVAGHMHEGEGKGTIENTLCVNTGLHNSLIIDTEEGVEFL